MSKPLHSCQFGAAFVLLRALRCLCALYPESQLSLQGRGRVWDVFSATAAPFCGSWVTAGVDSGFLVLDTQLIAQDVFMIPGCALVLLHRPGQPLCPVALQGQEGAENSLG